MSDNLDFILRARKAKQATDKAMAGIRKKYGLNKMQTEILVYLMQNPGSPASAFVKEMGFNKGAVSVGMDDLVSGGYVTLNQDNRDHRYANAFVTEKALPVFKDLEKIEKKFEKLLLAGISKAEIAALRKTAAKICRNFDKLDL